MNILVTGGAGYIGSVVVELLLARGDRVVVYDNLVKGHRAAVHPDAIFAKGDLLDTAELAATLGEHKIDAVIHLAAFTLAAESLTNPAKYFRNNVAGSVSLGDAMAAVGVRNLVFSSTAAVYGEPETMPIRESAPVQPASAYGAGKLAVEQLLPWYERGHGIKSVSLRYFNAAGASDRFGEVHDPETHLIPMVLQVALGQRVYIAINGDDYPTPDGTTVRDYIHVLDLARAHLLAVDYLLGGGASAVFNLGSGRGFSVMEVVETARRVTGRKISARRGLRRAGDPAILIASSDRIQEMLGWTPQYPDLEAIIDSAWRWLQAHPLGYSPD